MFNITLNNKKEQNEKLSNILKTIIKGLNPQNPNFYSLNLVQIKSIKKEKLDEQDLQIIKNSIFDTTSLKYLDEFEINLLNKLLENNTLEKTINILEEQIKETISRNNDKTIPFIEIEYLSEIRKIRHALKNNSSKIGSIYQQILLLKENFENYQTNKYAKKYIKETA